MCVQNGQCFLAVSRLQHGVSRVRQQIVRQKANERFIFANAFGIGAEFSAHVEERLRLVFRRCAELAAAELQPVLERVVLDEPLRAITRHIARRLTKYPLATDAAHLGNRLPEVSLNLFFGKAGGYAEAAFALTLRAAL